MGKFITSALPMVVGLATGNPMLGMALGAGMGMLTHQDPFMSAIQGGLGGMSGGTLFTGGGLSALGGGVATGGASAAGPLGAIASGGADAIGGISNALTLTGAPTATAAAADLGFGSTNAMLAAANPSWLTTGAALQGALQNIPGNILGRSAAPLSAGGAPVQVTPSIFGGAGGALGAGSRTAAGLGTGAGAGATGGGSLSGLLQMGSGVYGMSQAMQLQDLAKQANIMSPAAQAAAAKLAALQANPGLINQYPDYQAGLDAVQRSMAAQGYAGSGNMATALQKYGGQFYNQQVNELANIAGTGAQGAATAGALQGSGAQLASSALGSLGYAARGMGF